MLLPTSQATQISTASAQEGHTVYVRDIAECANSSLTGINYGSWNPITRTCKLTSDVNEDFVIDVDNITLDCAGHNIITPPGYYAYYPGVSSSYKRNTTIKNCIVQGFSNGLGVSVGIYFYDVSQGLLFNNTVLNGWYGFLIQGTSYINITSNIAQNNQIGFQISSSPYNTLRNNKLINNTHSLYIEFSGIEPADFFNDIDVSNTINGKPIYYLINKKNVQIPANAGFVAAVNCTNITVKNLNSSVMFAFTTDSRIESVNVSDGLFNFNYIFYYNYGFGGLFIYNSSRNIIKNVYINYTYDTSGPSGIIIISSSFNTLADNIVSTGYFGYVLSDSSNNTLIRNSVDGCNTGFFITSSSNNVLELNNASCATGFYVESGSSQNVLKSNSARNFGGNSFHISGSYSNRLISNIADSAYTGTGNGYFLDNSWNNTLSNNIARNNSDGFNLRYSSDVFDNNTAQDNKRSGFQISETWSTNVENNVLTNNKMINNTYNFILQVDPNMIVAAFNSIDTSNTVNGRPIYYLVNKKDFVVPLNAGYVAAINSTNITVRGLTLTNNGQGVLFAYTSNSIIENINASDNWDGFVLYNSSQNILKNNTAGNSNNAGFGIYLSSYNSLISNSASNSAYGGSYGFYAVYSSSSDLISNSAYGGNFGFDATYSSNLSIINNTAENNYNYGFYFYEVSNNTIKKNKADSSIYGSFTGFTFYFAFSNIISNNIAKNGGTGFLIDDYTSLNIFDSNSAYNNTVGFDLYGSNSSLVNNTAENNSNFGFSIYGRYNLTNNRMLNNKYNLNIKWPASWWSLTFNYFFQDIDTSNTVNGRPIYYLVNKKDFVVPLNAGYVAAINSTNITVRGLTLTNNGQGVLFAYTSNSTIENVNISGNLDGFVLYNSSQNILKNNTAGNSGLYGFDISDSSQYNILIKNKVENIGWGSGNGGFYIYQSGNNALDSNIATGDNYWYAGFSISQSSNTTLSSNEARNNYAGFSFYGLDNNTVINNTAESNVYGLLFSASNSNTITGNVIINNSFAGISLGGSLSNLIYNNFFNNTYSNVQDDTLNVWSASKTSGTNIIGGPFIGGNFWSDYNGTDMNGDGLGDTELPYNNSDQIQIGGDFAPLVPANVANVTLPSPELRIFKWGTRAVIGRVIDYYIVVQNVGNFPVNDTFVTESSEPSVFNLLSANPDAFFEKSDDQEGGEFISWNVSLAPFESKILSYEATINESIPGGTPVIGGPVCILKEVPCTSGTPPDPPSGSFGNPLGSGAQLGICSRDPGSGQGAGGFECRPSSNSNHYGVDLRAGIGTPVYPVEDGVVERVGWQNESNHNQGFGLRVYVRYPNGCYSVYAHLDSTSVTVGTQVTAGQTIIGKSGDTGNARGMPCPHLHFEYHCPTNPSQFKACSVGDPTGCPSIDPCAGLGLSNLPAPNNPCSCKPPPLMCWKLVCTWFPDVVRPPPRDPNEKGVIANKFITSNQTLVYPIHFENIGGSDALDVFVDDELGSDFNLSTLEILSLTEGFKPLHENETVTLFYQIKNQTIIIGNVTINITTVENWTATLVGRIIKWNISGIELPPNETDNVLLSIKPNLGLASGTEIRNNATIQFEALEKMTTNNTLNIIDDVAPVCTMNPLPNITQTLSFNVSWSGTDEIGEVSFFDIFVSVNNSNFTLFREVSDTSAVFDGEGNKTYAFYCTATDTAGNEEIQEPAAEAATRVALISGFYGFVNNALNYSVAEANVSVTGATSESILTDVVGAYYLSDLPFGNYSIKVSAPNFDEFRDNITIAGAILRKDISLRLAGDVKIDCVVNIFDLASVGLCFGKAPTGSCASADLNGDGKINIFDLATVGLNFGKMC